MQGSKLEFAARCARGAGAAVAVSMLVSCQGMAPEPREISSAHVNTSPPPAGAAAIPAPVRRTPFVPPPEPSAPVETYTVVVNEVPVKELLFALARDTAMNVDIHPDISGLVTLNAVDQTLQQILDRIARQLDLRYELRDNNIVIEPDTPFVRIYRVDYVNLTREASTTSSVSTQIATTATGAEAGAAGAGGGGGGNNSTTTVTSSTQYPFWATLEASIQDLLADGGDAAGEGDLESNVIANPPNGILMVRASSRQHEQVQEYLDEVLASARRQVLIEATIVEVELSDDYTAGVDWGELAEDAGVTLQQSLIGGAAAAIQTTPFFLLEYANSRDAAGNPNGDLSLTVRLLKEFGDTRVLSSPKVMALNNQTALLKVVENVVYFEVESDTTQAVSAPTLTTTTTTARSVSVGVVMSVTPQINDKDEVTLIVRPTISRVTGFRNDPNPTLTVPNEVPEIAVREMESVLRVGSGQLAVLGGLMQDEVSKESDGVPILSESKTFGELFTSRSNRYTKTELVIFLRPWVIRTPDVQADLKSFEPFLPENIERNPEPQKGRFEKNLP